MTDRPILFSGPMVQALVAGEKTQTRRVHFTQSPSFLRTCDNGCDHRLTGMCNLKADVCGRREMTKSRYANGDRLWVRESFRPAESGTSAPSYRATHEWPSMGRWKPGIHMPRALSRLTLVTTAVRVERLQIISENDAWNEGIRPEASGDFEGGDGATGAYRILWDGLNTARGFGWNANPWVVAVTFGVYYANIDTLPERIAA